jgi:hypothetical protein
MTLAAIAGRTKGYINWLTSSLRIIAGKATLVGYTTEVAAKNHLPILPPPIFDIETGIPKVLNVSQSVSALVTNYAKEAELKSDLRQLWELSKF